MLTNLVKEKKIYFKDRCDKNSTPQVPKIWIFLRTPKAQEHIIKTWSQKLAKKIT